MKKYGSNILFTLSFICIFSSVIIFYVDQFSGASSTTHFPEDQSFDIQSCQKWTEDVRTFNIDRAAKGVPVLMYHRIIAEEDLEPIHYDEEGNLYTTIVLEKEFQSQMEFLYNEGFTILTLREFEGFVDKDIEVPEKSVLLTFDDGFKDNFHVAFPVLDKFGFTAVNFLITSKITSDDEPFKVEQGQYLSLRDLNESCGVFEFQSHTYNFHQRAPEGGAFLVTRSKTEIERDLNRSDTNLNISHKAFAYPYGEYGTEAIEVLNKSGYSMAFTVVEGVARPGESRYEIPRIGILPTDNLRDFREKINP
ncbi:polysaccharide deacetylase family protein [Halobacillus faecis]|uniref:NodB homology domain-containing protein n=1 Tax=Halobacillus faecis TaxID=360184 RepID=A0A511WTM7_9BACI|nr:polysaccharide deacetylase family protein [Halobacillus faecis]GEN54485.1 hypothetical protein HFA01_27470 [Halobacillus faecis]